MQSIMQIGSRHGPNRKEGKNLNRNFIGIELDETYFKIAEERIDKERGGSVKCYIAAR